MFYSNGQLLFLTEFRPKTFVLLPAVTCISFNATKTFSLAVHSEFVTDVLTVPYLWYYGSFVIFLLALCASAAVLKSELRSLSYRFCFVSATCQVSNTRPLLVILPPTLCNNSRLRRRFVMAFCIVWGTWYFMSFLRKKIHGNTNELRVCFLIFVGKHQKPQHIKDVRF